MRNLVGLAALAAAVLTSGATAGDFVRPVPVRIGVNGPNVDACGSSGRPRGLNPRGDNFLAVKSAPSLDAQRTDRLGPGAAFFICGERGGWTAIVYSPRGGLPARCGVSWPVRAPRVYRGPCRSGWVASRYVEYVSG